MKSRATPADESDGVLCSWVEGGHGMSGCSGGRLDELAGITRVETEALCEFIDLVRAEARPVVLVGDDDRCLQVAECLDLLECGRILGEVPNLVIDAFGVQRAICRAALDAAGLGVNRDCHACFLCSV